MPVPRAMLLVVSAAVVVSWLTVTEGARRGCLTVESSPVSVICLGYTNVPATFPNDTENLKFQESAIGEIGSGDFNVSGLTHLKTLDISSSSVWRLGYEAFSAVLHLQQLFLDNNQISIIEEDAFAGLTELWYLNLQSNNISYIPAGLFNDLHSLQHLSLLDNRLTSIDASVLTGLPLQSLTVLLLDRNPWTCNCSIAALGYWLVLPSTGLILDYSTLRCQDGEQALALLLASSQADYQMCPPYWPPEDIRAIAHPQCLAVRLYWRHLSEETGEAELYTFSSVDALGNASETEDFFSAYFIDNSAVTDDPFENATESVATATTPLVTGDAAVTVDMGNVTRGRATTSFHVTYWPDAHPDDVTVVETARLYVDLKDLKEGETYWVKIAVENEYGLGPTSEPSSFTTHDGMWNCSEAIVEVDLAGRTEDEGHGHIGIMVAVILTCIVLIIAVVLITRCTVRRRRANSVQLTTSRSPLNLNRSKRLAHVPTEDSISLTSAHSLHSISSADSEMVKRKPRPLNVVNRDRIKFIRNLYTGRFGTLYQAELDSHIDTDPVRVVMVKEFAPELASHTRLRHERQATNIGGLSHPNVHGLVGIVRDPNPSIVYEFLEWGDLKSFLLSNMPKTRRGFYQSKRDTISRTLKKAGLFGYAGKRVAFPLTTNDIVTMAMQVAGGMAYLSRNGFVHKDLAARNCLVGMDMQVKVSDLGLSKELYPGDYVKMLRRSLPIRWMAPESIKANIFTRYSDIWAFGVLLWEMFSYGNKPYSYRGDNEVVVYLTRGGLLMKPDKCPVEAYNLMLGCWKEIPRDRTKFEVLQAKLKDLSIMETSL